MRYSASEKLEIIRLVEQSHLPVRRTLEQIGMPSDFYRWYEQYQTGGPEALDDRSRPDRVWNRIPDDVRVRVVELGPRRARALAARAGRALHRCRGYFVSEASVYRLLKAHDLITSPAFIMMKAADEFKNKTTAPNELWQTDFTYLKVTRLGLVLSVNDPRRLLPLHHRLEALHHDESRGRHRHVGDGSAGLRVGSGYCDASTSSAHRQRVELRLRRPGRMARAAAHATCAWCALSSDDAGQNRALASRSRTASCSRTIICPAISKLRSMYSSRTTTTGAVTRASTISHPADVYFGRGQTILLERERIKRQTIENRRLLHHKQAA